MAVNYYSHIGIAVADLDVARRFYNEALGFGPVGDVDATSGGDLVSGELGKVAATLLELDEFEARVDFLSLGKQRIELVEYRRPRAIKDSRRPTNFCGLTHLGVSVSDLDAAASAVERLGGRTVQQTRAKINLAGGHACDVLVCLSPDGGTRIQLVEGTGSSAEQSASEAENTTVPQTFVSATVSDVARARRFFVEGLGFTRRDSTSVAGASAETDFARVRELDALDAEVEVLDRDGMSIQLVGHVAPPAVVGTRRPTYYCGPTHMCVDVDDIDATAADLARLGGTVLTHTETGGRFGRDVQRLILCLDPDGGIPLELKQAVPD